MPRHAFSFPPDVQDAVRRHVSAAVSSVDPTRFRQEGPYTAALARALEGTAYHGPHGRVLFQSTVVDSDGPGAAERWSGADLAITAEVSDGKTYIRKAILVQAKRGDLTNLPKKERDRLRGQIEDMRKLTNAPKIMDIPAHGHTADPAMYSGIVFAAGDDPKRYRLADYFVQRFLTTLDGDTSSAFVDAVQDSGLTTLKVIAKKHP